MALNEGDVAPDFELKGVDGKSHSLKEFRGKRIVLYFYPKDDTPGCTIEAKGFTAHDEEIKKLNAVVLGISADDYDSHCRFKDKYGLSVLILSDQGSKTIREYGAYGNRGVFGMGTIRSTFIIGGDGKILKIYRKVQAEGHAEAIVNLLKSMN